MLHHLLHDGRVDGPRGARERAPDAQAQAQSHPDLHRLLVAALDDPRVGYDLVDVRALVGVGDEHLADEVAAQRAHKVGDGVLRVDDLLVELHEGAPVEGELPADKDVEEDAQTPAVHLGPGVFVPLNELW